MLILVPQGGREERRTARSPGLSAGGLPSPAYSAESLPLLPSPSPARTSPIGQLPTRGSQREVLPWEQKLRSLLWGLGIGCSKSDEESFGEFSRNALTVAVWRPELYQIEPVSSTCFSPSHPVLGGRT